MRFFSFRNKRLLKRILLTILCVLGALAVLIVARISYLGRYVVYSDGKVHFDKNQKLERKEQIEETHDGETYEFETVFPEDTGERPELSDTQLRGFYISTTMLADGVDSVRQALAQEEGYNAVVLDVKSPLGNFY